MESKRPLPADSIRPKEAAAILGVDVQSVYRWVLSGKLPAVRVGGCYRLSRADVLGLARGVRVERRRPANRAAYRVWKEQLLAELKGPTT